MHTLKLCSSSTKDCTPSDDEKVEDVPTLKVAIIGCGPSGLSILRALKLGLSKDDTVRVSVEVVCYEKQADWGGQWLFSPTSGVAESGEAVHSAQYSCMWSNAPKECYEYADYTWLEHFGHAVPSFMPRAAFANYICARARLLPSIRRCVQFNTVVRWVTERGDQFEVSVENLKTRTTETQVFDKIIVATGHFSVPHMPSFDGMDTFEGSVIHSKDFRSPKMYAGKRVVFIGSSNSAQDLSIWCLREGAKDCIISCHEKPSGLGWPKGIREFPQIHRINGNKVTFVNGTGVEEVDAIILCTGYLHHYPFLPSSLRLVSANTLYVKGLYNGTVWNKNPNLFYIGAQENLYSLTMFDAEARYVADVILGEIPLPSKEKREKHMMEWTSRLSELKDIEGWVRFQAMYISELMACSRVTEFDIDIMATVPIFLAWRKTKSENMTTWRNISYTTVAGDKQPDLETPFMDIVDNDALQIFKRDS